MQPGGTRGPPTPAPTAHRAQVGQAVLRAVCRLLQPRQRARCLSLQQQQVLHGWGWVQVGGEVGMLTDQVGQVPILG